MKVNFKIAGSFLSDNTINAVKNALMRIEGLELDLHVPGKGWSISDVDTAAQPDLFIYELRGDNDLELDEFEAFIETHREAFPIFVSYANGDINTIRRLMRAGIKDVFPQPIQGNELAQAVIVAISEKRKKIKTSMGGKGGVTCFVNTKGGSGTTTIATNVAYALAKEHKAEVAILDFDIQFGSVALQLDLHPKNSIMEALIQPDRVDPVFVRALMTRHEGSGLDVLASPADLSPIDGISAAAVNRLLAAAAEVYDYVIIDLPRIYTPWTLAAMKFADPVMLVIQNDLATIRDAKLMLERMNHDGVSLANIELINNRAMSKDSSVTIDQLKETLGREMVRRVRNDHKTAAHAEDQGRPIIEVAKHSHLTEDVGGIANYIVEQHTGGKSRPKHGLFSWLFSS